MKDYNKIKIIISDIDGVWTDGSVYKGTDNMEFKKFSVFDGVGAFREAVEYIIKMQGRTKEVTKKMVERVLKS